MHIQESISFLHPHLMSIISSHWERACTTRLDPHIHFLRILQNVWSSSYIKSVSCNHAHVINVWFNNSYIKSVPWQQNHSSCDQSSSDVRMKWRCCHRRWIDRSIDDQGCIHFWPASRVVHASQTIDGSSTCAGSPPIIVWRRPDGTKFLWIYARIQLGGAPWSTSTGAHLASDRSVAELMKNSRAWFVRGLARPLGWVLEELDQGFMVYAWAYNSMLCMT
jgi:hypothetical protein